MRHATVRGFTQSLDASTASNPFLSRQEDSCESLCATAELVLDFRKVVRGSEEHSGGLWTFCYDTTRTIARCRQATGLPTWAAWSCVTSKNLPRWKCRCLKSHPSSTLCRSRHVEGLRHSTAGMQMFFKSVAGTCEALRLWHVRDSTNILDGEAQAMVLLQVPRWCLGPSLLWFSEHGFAENVGEKWEKQPQSHANEISIQYPYSSSNWGVYRPFCRQIPMLRSWFSWLGCPSTHICFVVLRHVSPLFVFACHLAPVLPQNRHRQEHLSHSRENSVTWREWN